MIEATMPNARARRGKKTALTPISGGKETSVAARIMAPTFSAAVAGGEGQGEDLGSAEREEQGEPAEEAHGDDAHAGRRASGEREPERVVQALPRRGRGADVRPQRDVHADVTREPGAERSHEEA